MATAARRRGTKKRKLQRDSSVEEDEAAFAEEKKQAQQVSPLRKSFNTITDENRQAAPYRLSDEATAVTPAKPASQPGSQPPS